NGAPVAAASTAGFIARVSSLPLIHDSVSTLHSYAKDNKYSRYALDTAGSAVETVSKYTEPYSTRLQPAISKVDQIATKSLDVFETTFPIVTKPTSEIVTQVKKPYNNATVIKSKESIQALNIRLNALIEAVRAHAIELQENVQKVPSEASQRVQTLSTSLLVEIDSLSVYLKEHSPKLPVYVQVRLEPLVGFVNDRYVTVKGEMVKPDVSALQKARNILQLTTEETLPILQSAAQEVKESL
ncbi:hypothetical protein K457DRAFT_53583, partial [Linnemannia elongata AG-77]